jgi:hypothetical protein
VGRLATEGARRPISATPPGPAIEMKVEMAKGSNEGWAKTLTIPSHFMPVYSLVKCCLYYL